MEKLDPRYVTQEEHTNILELLQSTNNSQKEMLALIENQQHQIRFLQKQIDLIANMHTADPSTKVDIVEGLKNLHNEALKTPTLPEGASKTGEGEDEHD